MILGPQMLESAASVLAGSSTCTLNRSHAQRSNCAADSDGELERIKGDQVRYTAHRRTWPRTLHADQAITLERAVACCLATRPQPSRLEHLLEALQIVQIR